MHNTHADELKMIMTDIKDNILLDELGMITGEEMTEMLF